jgi:ribonuclease HI
MTARSRDTKFGVAPGALPARLFSEPDHPTDIFTAEVDGASRGNPGPASYAVIIRRPDGSIVYQLGKYLGRATNNVAEYFALITALDYCASSNIHRLRVRSDSELLVLQMQGKYKVKSASLKPLHERALRQAKSLSYFAVEHVPREMNSDADALANSALDRTGDVSSSVRVLTAAKAGTNHMIRARYKDGVLHPAEPLDVPDGAEVEIVVRQKAKD